VGGAEAPVHTPYNVLYAPADRGWWPLASHLVSNISGYWRFHLGAETETESELTLNNPMAVTVNMVSRKVVKK